MADKTAPADFILNLADLALYEEFGGGVTYVEKIGYARARITSLNPAPQSDAGNDTATCEVELMEPGLEGTSIAGKKPFAGTNAKMKLARNFGDILRSVGYTVDQIRGLAANGQASFVQSVAGLIGKECYVEIKTGRLSDGKPVSNIDRFVSKEVYDKRPGLREDKTAAHQPAALGAMAGLGGATPAAAMGLPGAVATIPAPLPTGAAPAQPAAAAAGAGAAANSLLNMLQGAKV